jgi:hypothetical protein
MPTLAEQFAVLSPDAKRRVHFILGAHALSKWHAYCNDHPRVHYVETVCGTRQTVDSSLPGDALACAEQERDDREVAERYQEPIAAMQDDDLEFPDPVAFAYYAIYNLFRKYAKHEPLDDWLIVNQSLSSEQEESQWRSLLESAIQSAK